MSLITVCDWPGFLAELLPSQKREHPKPPRRDRHHSTQPQTLWLAGDQQEPTGEMVKSESNILVNPLSHVYTQVT